MAETQHVQDCDLFHLHNNRSRCELKVHMNSLRLKHGAHPVYLGVTLDRTLSYREHLTLIAAKLKSRNNLIAELTGTSWGASTSTLHTSALALCYSVAEYCCPVSARYSYRNLINTKLRSTMHLSADCLHRTELRWLPVLTNVTRPSLHHKVATVTVTLSPPEQWSLQQFQLFRPLKKC